MNNEEIKDNDIFQCKMYITDLETKKDSKEIDVSDLVFNDWIEFEFGNYEDEDYTQLPYKDFKFFINDYSVTFYSPQYQKALKEIERLNNIIKLKTDFIHALLEIIYFSDDKPLHSKAHLIGEKYEDKLKELKGEDNND